MLLSAHLPARLGRVYASGIVIPTTTRKFSSATSVPGDSNYLQSLATEAISDMASDPVPSTNEFKQQQQQQRQPPQQSQGQSYGNQQQGGPTAAAAAAGLDGSRRSRREGAAPRDRIGSPPSKSRYSNLTSNHDSRRRFDSEEYAAEKKQEYELVAYNPRPTVDLDQWVPATALSSSGLAAELVRSTEKARAGSERWKLKEWEAYDYKRYKVSVLAVKGNYPQGFRKREEERGTLVGEMKRLVRRNGTIDTRSMERFIFEVRSRVPRDSLLEPVESTVPALPAVEKKASKL
jgi:hypothetical protein